MPTKEGYLKNKEYYCKYAREYRLKNKEKVSEYNKQYRLKNINVINARMIKWREENRERLNAEARSPEAKKRQRERDREKRKNSTFHLITMVRRRIHYILGGRETGYKTLSTLELLGVKNIETVWEHLEKYFKPGMTRKNNTVHGWHIDHHIPINYFKKNFNFMDLEVQKKCFHYTNLRPLWAKDNLKKGGR
tara:strand:+ start:46 stop:621 length:576 start_codon:yes stop_codon:yes gene_type:complete